MLQYGDREAAVWASRMRLWLLRINPDVLTTGSLRETECFYDMWGAYCGIPRFGHCQSAIFHRSIKGVTHFDLFLVRDHSKIQLIPKVRQVDGES